MTRPREAELPKFPPLKELKPGCAFNPYRLFYSFSLHQALSRCRKISASARWVWATIAAQVYEDGLTKRPEAEMAWRCGLSVAQYRRHLGALEHAKLLHREMRQGYTSYVWLRFHNIFASCSPNGTRTSERTPRAELSGPPLTSERPLVDPLGRSNGRGAVNQHKATSSSGWREAKGRFLPENEGKANGTGGRPITDKPFTLRLDSALERSFRTWSPKSREIRLSQIQQVFEQVEHFQRYTDDHNPQIQRQARHELKRSLVELTTLGGLAFAGQRRIFP